MLGVHASGVCTGIGPAEQIGREIARADGRRLREEVNYSSLPVQKHRGEQGHTHRDEHTVMKTRCPGHAGPGTNPGRRTEESAPSELHWRTHITNPTTCNSLPPPPALRRAPPVRAPPASAREVIRVGAIWGRRNRIFIRFLIRSLFYKLPSTRHALSLVTTRDGQHAPILTRSTSSPPRAVQRSRQPASRGFSSP